MHQGDISTSTDGWTDAKNIFCAQLRDGWMGDVARALSA